MAVHLKKLSVGTGSLDELRQWQILRRKQAGRVMHVTRNHPRRADELIDGGSIYWIIKGVMTARQRILDVADVVRADGRPACGLVLADDLVSVVPRRMRVFQGWRYLEVADAPADLGSADSHELPSELVAELRQLGIF